MSVETWPMIERRAFPRPTRQTPRTLAWIAQAERFAPPNEETLDTDTPSVLQSSHTPDPKGAA